MNTTIRCGNSPSESRMREIRPSGSEGGVEQTNAPSLPPMCADALMKPTSESLSLEATRYLKVAEGYCVSARAGGEQSEAKDQPQTRVNPIRPCSMTSRRTGGICARVWVPGEVRGASPAVSHNITRSVWTAGCCGVCGVGMVRRFHKLSQDRWSLRRGVVRRQSPHSSDEAGNDRGAKGDRKVNAP